MLRSSESEIELFRDGNYESLINLFKKTNGESSIFDLYIMFLILGKLKDAEILAINEIKKNGNFFLRQESILSRVVEANKKNGNWILEQLGKNKNE